MACQPAIFSSVSLAIIVKSLQENDFIPQMDNGDNSEPPGFYEEIEWVPPSPSKMNLTDPHMGSRQI